MHVLMLQLKWCEVKSFHNVPIAFHFVISLGAFLESLVSYMCIQKISDFFLILFKSAVVTKNKIINALTLTSKVTLFLFIQMYVLWFMNINKICFLIQSVTIIFDIIDGQLAFCMYVCVIYLLLLRICIASLVHLRGTRGVKL